MDRLTITSGNFTKNANMVGWCLTAGSAGHEAQCIGLFESLGIKPIIKRVNPQGWYKKLAPIGRAQPHLDVVPPWPDLLIVAGRQALPYARYIKRHSRGRTFVVVLQKPGLPNSWFDFIWVPLHDKKTGRNVLGTLTPPNRLSKKAIFKETAQYQPLVEGLPTPLVTVLVGGPSRSFQFSLDDAEQLVHSLIKLHNKTGCSFLISPSYRTGKAIIDLLHHRLADIPARIWDMSGENPYFSYLGLGEFFIITADSINMLGEAAFTGRPIYAYPLAYRHKKFNTFYQSMIDYGALRWFNGELETWTYEPLDATLQIANEIERKLKLHLSQLK